MTIGTPIDLWNKVMKEVQEGRYAGPYNLEDLPFENLIQSPIGLVPKADNKMRLIFHLSYDFEGGIDIDKKSLNFHTPKDMCSVKYKDLDHAIANCLKLLQNDSQIIWFMKSDASHAFCVLPILPRQRKFLVLMAPDPRMGKRQYFIDMCLPFGSSINCVRYQDFSDALSHMAQYKFSTLLIRPVAITNYLDDSLFIALCINMCNGAVTEFLVMCESLGCPMSVEKTEYASEIIIFLGMLFDGRRHLIGIPNEKKIKALNLLNFAIQHRNVTIKFIQQLTSILNFLNRAIVLAECSQGQSTQN